MFEKLNNAKSCIALVGASISSLLGVRGVLFLVLFVLMIADYITGVLSAVNSGAWKSSVARQGVAHKLGMIVVCAVAGVMDFVITYVLAMLPDFPIAWGCFMFPLVVVWYIVGEIGSIVENAVALGAPVPKWLLEAIEAGKTAVDKTAEKENEK